MEGETDDSSNNSEDVEKRQNTPSPTPPVHADVPSLLRHESSSMSSTAGAQESVAHLTSTQFTRSGHQREDTYAQCETALAELDMDAEVIERRASVSKRRSSRARFANKVLGRLYSRRAYSDGLVFASGHFLGDVSKMVAGLVSSDVESLVGRDVDDGSSTPAYGFGENRSTEPKDVVIYEQGAEEHLVHSSTLAAGREGCVVLVFPKASLIPFLDEYPGLLLSLLGTQVVV